MSSGSFRLFLFTALLFSTGVALAEHDGASRLTVVELFTSQSCSSCPPAEANLRRLSERREILALEWHVDYWDDLRAGASGRWKDPYSHGAFTARQRRYNVRLRNTSGVYTPQAVIDGAKEIIGSRRAEIDAAIAMTMTTEAPFDIVAERRRDRMAFLVRPQGLKPQGEVRALLVTFIPETTTRVPAGENAGKSLTEVNVVTQARDLGPVGRAARFSVPIPPRGRDCALLIEAKNGGPIFAAAKCP